MAPVKRSRAILARIFKRDMLDWGYEVHDQGGEIVVTGRHGRPMITDNELKRLQQELARHGIESSRERGVLTTPKG